MVRGSTARCCAPMAAWFELTAVVRRNARHRQSPSTIDQRIRVMKQVIVITGASSGFGALTARALAHAGHIVYASMRETTGRNASQVAEVARYAAEHSVDLRAVELDVASDQSAEAGIVK